MATKKAADSTLYHLSPKGFWKKFRDAVVVNPEISSGIPIAGVNRYPPPGSRPEKYATPMTKASDPAQNPYWKRDVRRAYPRLSVVTQSDMSSFLLQYPEAKSLTPPAEDSTDATVPAPQEQLQLPAVIEAITSKRKLYTESSLPPTIPSAYKRWTPERAPDAPHAPHSYFPMVLYK